MFIRKLACISAALIITACNGGGTQVNGVDTDDDITNDDASSSISAGGQFAVFPTSVSYDFNAQEDQGPLYDEINANAVDVEGLIRVTSTQFLQGDYLVENAVINIDGQGAYDVRVAYEGLEGNCAMLVIDGPNEDPNLDFGVWFRSDVVCEDSGVIEMAHMVHEGFGNGGTFRLALMIINDRDQMNRGWDSAAYHIVRNPVDDNVVDNAPMDIRFVGGQLHWSNIVVPTDGDVCAIVQYRDTSTNFQYHVEVMETDVVAGQVISGQTMIPVDANLITEIVIQTRTDINRDCGGEDPEGSRHIDRIIVNG